MFRLLPRWSGVLKDSMGIHIQSHQVCFDFHPHNAITEQNMERDVEFVLNLSD